MTRYIELAAAAIAEAQLEQRRDYHRIDAQAAFEAVLSDPQARRELAAEITKREMAE